jgi:hypothetical protein
MNGCIGRLRIGIHRRRWTIALGGPGLEFWWICR